MFQPHLYSRTKNFFKEFAKALSKSDVVILTDIYPAREEQIEGITSKIIFDNLDGVDSYILDKKDICNKISSISKENDMIIVMGAGDIKLITSDIYKKIEACNA